MTDKEHPSHDSSQKEIKLPQRLQGGSDATETIDLGGLFTKDVTSSGSFDLRDHIRATAFGKLTEALPIPALLIDQGHNVIGVNQACGRISPEYEKILGTQFSSLFPHTSPARQTKALVEEIFATRKPRIKEGILQIARGKMWGRMTFRPIRIGGQRLALVLVEDLTREKKELLVQQKLNKQLNEEIVRRQEAEHELAEREKQYREVVETAGDIIFRTDSQGYFTFLNQAALRVMACSREEIIGRHFRELVAPEFKKPVERFYRTQLIKRLPFTYYEFPVVTKHGETVWLGQNTQLMSEAGSIIGSQAIARDITERRRAEEALELERKKSQLLAESAPFGMAMISKNGDFQYINSKFKELFGYDLHEVPCGKEWFRKAFPDRGYRHEVVASWIEDVNEIKIGESRPRTFTVTCKDGAEKIILFRPVQLYTGDHAMTCEDITERERMENALKESEARFREFAESVPQLVCEMDRKGFFTFINRNGLQALGYSMNDLDQGVNVADVVVPADRERITKNLATLSDRGRAIGNDYLILRKDGTAFPVVAYTSPIVKEGSILGSRAVVVDVTELKEAERILKRSRDELEMLVTERTFELEAANERLRREILERMDAQQSLAASEERFRGIFETARDCVFIKDLNLTYTFVNPYMTNLLGLSESTIVGKNDEELFGVPAGQHLREVDYRVLNGEVIEEEHTRPVKGAPMIFLDVRAPLTNSEGQIVGICGIARNVTERKVLASSDLAVRSEYTSPSMRAAIATASLAAASDSTVLLSGESGSGKDHLARYIHEHSHRSSGPFYSINCAAIPPQLAESELFGHEAGAFTGATRNKRGLIELAEGGTLLLNEISELPRELQSKLLTFFDTMSFTRVGGQQDVKVNVRILAATNLDLYKEAVDGRFRKDLYYRLNVFAIKIPPLRERIEDLPPLVSALLSELAGRMGFSKALHYNEAIIAMLGRYPWPGNIRELRNVLERALILSQGEPLRLEHIVLETNWPPTELPKMNSTLGKPFDEIMGSIERQLIQKALQECEGNKTLAAQCLGISRFALSRHMRKIGLDEL